MKVLNKFYLTPNDEGKVLEDRSKYMTAQYIKLARDFMQRLELHGKVAFLYAAGVTLQASEARNANDENKYREQIQDSTLAIKEVSAYSMHKWIGTLKTPELIKHASINANTCASSMYSLYEAEQLLHSGFDEVIIVAEEKTSFNTIRVFDEHDINLKLGEALAIVHLGKGEGISNTKWGYEYSRNPFGVTVSGYKEVYTDTPVVNPHGTGTEVNETAETSLFVDKKQLRYKEQYGHTQGVSGLLEVCLVLDASVNENVLCVSSGLGGFYGSCVVQKQ